MKILHLNVYKQWYDMIAYGNKREEYRERSDYWWSRLYDKRAAPKQFDAIEIRNGYGRNAPRIMMEHVLTKICMGRKSWGAPEHSVFVIVLGKRIYSAAPLPAPPPQQDLLFALPPSSREESAPPEKSSAYRRRKAEKLAMHK